MAHELEGFLQRENQNLKDAGLFKFELPVESPQKPVVTANDRELVNLASANYLGFSNHPNLKRAAKVAIDEFGVGVAAPRMLSGTQTAHGRLERQLAGFLEQDDAMVFGSGYHANTGLFESLFSDRDYVFIDSLTHPSLADGVRLAKCRALSYRSGDLEDLEDRLKRSRGARYRVIVTDGVYPLDGDIAPLNEICGLALRYDALVVLHDPHGIGVLGDNGRGCAERHRALERVTVITGSFNYALGGGGGGFVAGSQDLVSWLRQKSRPYLVSSALPPVGVATASEAIKLVDREPQLRQRLSTNTETLKGELEAAGLEVLGGEHPILCVLVGHAVSAQKITNALYEAGIYAIGYCHPVVPDGEARVRLQVSAKHTKSALKRVAEVIGKAWRDLR
ncbi:MAG: aminotransferase class I/II-fold pyridoxal phosphate-dependent enzyme [Myxococcota bacterium]